MMGGLFGRHPHVTGLFVFLAACLLGLLIAELTLRIFAPQITIPHPRGHYALDPELDFILTPNRSSLIANPEWKMQVVTNTLGLREREFDIKGPEERRLLILGDSFTFGMGVAAEEAYPRVMEQQLRAAGFPNVMVINGGMPGYGTRQSEILFERIVERALPDAVLLGFFVGNDFFDNLRLNRYQMVDGYLALASRRGTRLSLTQWLQIPVETKVALRTRSHLYTALMNAWSSIIVAAGWADTYEIYRQDLSPEMIEAISMTGEAFARLAGACRARNLPFGILILPEGRVAAGLPRISDYSFDRPSAIVRDLASTHGHSVLDLTDTLAQRDDLYYPVDRHWNVSGHRVVSQLVTDALLQGEFRSLLAAPDALPTHSHR